MLETLGSCVFSGLVIDCLLLQAKKEHPEEAAKIEALIRDLVAMHSDLQKKAITKLEEAEQTQGQQMFDDAYRFESGIPAVL